MNSKKLKKEISKARGVKLKKMDLSKISDYQIQIKKKPHKQKLLAEVLVGAAIAAGVSYAVKKLLDAHHKTPAPAQKAKKTVKKKVAGKKKK